jgi:hypothetical protein
MSFDASSAARASFTDYLWYSCPVRRRELAAFWQVAQRHNGRERRGAANAARRARRVHPGKPDLSWSHRPELDGIRTIAVYLVVLFHGGLAAFSGGYIGVDLFFVLSGFLLTNVILADVDEHGTLRFGWFYGRRVRRLLPAAVVAIHRHLVHVPTDHLGRAAAATRRRRA